MPHGFRKTNTTLEGFKLCLQRRNVPKIDKEFVRLASDRKLTVKTPEIASKTEAYRAEAIHVA